MPWGREQLPVQMVVGLGNPGRRYETTRHNAGFMIIDLLADELEVSFEPNKPHRSLIARKSIAGEKILLVKPQTYMNNSGLAVASLANWYRIPPEEILVIYDDVNIPLGRLRIRPKGSSGGHRGMESVINNLGTVSVPRIRIGIGTPSKEEDGDIVDFVLRPFSEEEWDIVSQALVRGAHAARFLIDGGELEEAMNRYNG